MAGTWMAAHCEVAPKLAEQRLQTSRGHRLPAGHTLSGDPGVLLPLWAAQQGMAGSGRRAASKRDLRPLQASRGPVSSPCSAVAARATGDGRGRR